MSEASREHPAVGKNKRHCPALGGPIGTAECGARRGTQLKCPVDCPFFPFGTAAPELWGRLSNRWLEKAIKYTLSKVGRPRLERVLADLGGADPEDSGRFNEAFESALYTLLFLPGREGGASLADRWEAERWTGLNNDEQMMMRCRRQSRVTVFEIERTVPETGLIECLDLLAPGERRFRLRLPETTTPLVRFTRLFGWVTEYPHFTWPGFNLRTVPRELWPAWRAEIERRHQAAVAGRPDLTLERFLRETVFESEQMFEQLMQDREKQWLASLDFYRCQARFSLTIPAEEAANALRSEPDFTSTPVPDSDAQEGLVGLFTWKPQTQADSAGPPPEPGAKASAAQSGAFVHLFGDSLLLEVVTRRRYAVARARIEAVLGDRIRFDQEKIEDLQERMREQAERERAVRAAEAAVFGEQPGPAGPRRTADPGRQGATNAHPTPEQIQEDREKQNRYYRDLLDQPQADLDGATPRAAAADPALRPRLIEFVKVRMYALETHRLRTGTPFDFGWVLDELGLTELK
jgi:hypothetical protein